MYFKTRTLIIVIILSIIFIFILCLTEYLKDKSIDNNSMKTYNNGICIICGGQYKFLQAVGHHYNTYYIYKCDQCGELVETNIYFHN